MNRVILTVAFLAGLSGSAMAQQQPASVTLTLSAQQVQLVWGAIQSNQRELQTLSADIAGQFQAQASKAQQPAEPKAEEPAK